MNMDDTLLIETLFKHVGKDGRNAVEENIALREQVRRLLESNERMRRQLRDSRRRHQLVSAN